MIPQTLIDWVAQGWPSIKAACKVVISLGGLLAAVLAVLVAFADIPGGLNALAAKIDDVTGIVEGLPTHALMDKVNRIFPLSEFSALLLAHLGLLVACTIVRWLKAALLFWSGG